MTDLGRPNCPQEDAPSAPVPPAPQAPTRWWVWLGPTALVLVLLLWSHWDIVKPLWQDWQHNENYSVCQLVPLAALWLVWRERRRLRECTWAPCWWGLGLLAAAQLLRWEGLEEVRESLGRYALVLTLWSLLLLLGGRQVFSRLRWVLLFLLLMVPLPQAIDSRISNPLQALSARGAVVLLELSGVTVSFEGNAISLNENTGINVAEACSGLRMLTAFIVVAAVLAYLIRRPRWQKGLLLASSVPVAIACNLVRLFLTAHVFMWTSSEMVRQRFHDGAGYAMMPVAVGLLIGELWIFRQLVTPSPPGK
jgi:exosortase